MNIVSTKLEAVQAAASTPTAITAIDSAMKYRSDEWALETMLEDSAFVANNTSIQPYFSSMQPTNLGASTRANEELLLPDSLTAMLESAIVNPVSTILSNHKVVQEVRVDDEKIDSLELASLLAIAEKCEELGGKGVNIARSMLAAEGIFIWDDPVCETKSQPQRKQSDATEPMGIAAECWPNPSSGRMYIRFDEAAFYGKLKVMDATGRILLSKPFQYAGEPLEVDASVWAQGLFLVQVELQDGKLFTWRILLER